LLAAPDRWQAGLLFLHCFQPHAARTLEKDHLSQRTPYAVCLAQPILRRAGRFLRAPGRFGRHQGPANSVTDLGKYEIHEYDVLVIGAGGAGLRAAIEALAQGAKVAVVSKSLLGKAHTVMAEGGIAAAMANVDHADSWKTHFRDTMRGGKLINNW